MADTDFRFREGDAAGLSGHPGRRFEPFTVAPGADEVRCHMHGHGGTLAGLAHGVAEGGIDQAQEQAAMGNTGPVGVLVAEPETAPDFTVDGFLKNRSDQL